MKKSTSTSTSTGEAIFGCFVAIVASVAADFIGALGLWLVYNAIAPAFHWPHIDYWTAFMIVVGIGIVISVVKNALKD